MQTPQKSMCTSMQHNLQCSSKPTDSPTNATVLKPDTQYDAGVSIMYISERVAYCETFTLNFLALTGVSITLLGTDFRSIPMQQT